jgi:hypothetical protein
MLGQYGGGNRRSLYGGGGNPWDMPMLNMGAAPAPAPAAPTAPSGGSYDGPGANYGGGMSLDMGGTEDKLKDIGGSLLKAGGTRALDVVLPGLGLATDVGFGLWGAYDAAEEAKVAEANRKAERSEDKAERNVDRRIAQQQTDRSQNMSGIDRMMQMAEMAERDSRRRTFKKALSRGM